MTDYAKSVFSNRELLEQKLAIYLDDANDAKKLAPTFEKFFKAGGGVRLKFKPSWTWWGLFTFGFLFRYKLYFDFSVVFIAWIISLFVNDALNSAISTAILFTTMYTSKFNMAKRFEKALDSGDDAALKGGKNPMWLSVVVFFAVNIVLNTIFGLMLKR